MFLTFSSVPKHCSTVQNKFAVLVEDLKSFSYSFDSFCKLTEGNPFAVLPTSPLYSVSIRSPGSTKFIRRPRFFGAPRSYYPHGIQCFRFHNLSQDGDIELNPGPHGNVDFVLGRVNERTPEPVSQRSNIVYSSPSVTQRRPLMSTKPMFYSYSSADLKTLRCLRTTLPHQVLLNVQQLNIRRHRGCRSGRRRKTGRSISAVVSDLRTDCCRRQAALTSSTTTTVETDDSGEIPVVIGKRDRRLHSDRRQLSSTTQTRNLIVINCRSASVNQGSTAPLSTYVVNACSLKKHNAIQLLSAEVLNYDIDVAAVTETWLNNSVASSDLTITGYNLIRCDRLRRKGGGLCVFVKNCLVVDRLTLPLLHTCSNSDEFHEVLYLKVTKCLHDYLFILIYHPPRPKYKPDSLLARLTNDIEYFIDNHPSAIIYLTGDFNCLNTSQLESDLGLQQLVTQPTRRNSTLDLFFTNRPNEVQCSVSQSCMKTDHRALLINCTPPSSTPTHRRTVHFFDLRKPFIDALALMVSEYDWSCVLQCTDIDLAYERFLSVIETLTSLNIPQHTITIRDNTPKYITPLVKHLLRKRNKLLRKGRVTDANSLSLKIGRLITETRSNQLSNVAHKDVRKLWSSVSHTTSSKSKEALNSSTSFSADQLADYFTQIATDTSYDSSSITEFINSLSRRNFCSSNQTTPPLAVYEYDVFKCLSRVRKTSPGPDNTPYWLFKHCALELTPVITHIINLTLIQGKPLNYGRGL